MIRRLYPQGKKKAFNITYDDGVLQDIRFVEMLNRYNLKGTFNLNSELMFSQFEWVHPSGLVVKRLPVHTVVDLYRNHEIASHSLTHPYMHDLSENEILHQMGRDKYNLEQVFGREVTGFAVPFSFYSNLIADCARRIGFEYARCSDESYSYIPPENYYWWTAGTYHINPRFKSFAEGFFTAKNELALLQIVGHSYDLETENMWDYMDNLLRRISKDDSIISLTNSELVRYLKSMRSAEINDKYITNHSETELWFEVSGNVVKVNPHSRFEIAF